MLENMFDLVDSKYLIKLRSQISCEYNMAFRDRSFLWHRIIDIFKQ